MRYLGGEVSVEDALAVQVVKAAGDVQRQVHPHAPRQVQVTVQQLLQVAPIYILEMGTVATHEHENSIKTNFSHFRSKNGNFSMLHFSLKVLDCFRVPLSEHAVGLRERKHRET